jgi:histidine triad (HIT) family protein
MSTLFSKIISGEIPSFKISEDANHIAFLDIQPLVMGHVLCVPKVEVDYIFDLTPEALAALWVFTATVAKALKQAVPCKRIGTAVIGLEVPHTHIHLVPLMEVGDINFTKTKLNPSAESLKAMAAHIQSFL